MDCLSSAGDTLSPEESSHASIVGDAFLKMYISLVHSEPDLWRLRPKLHMVWHLVHDAELRPSRRNPLLDSTWQDEDWVKRVARTLKRCHSRSAQKTVLQRYLLALQQKLREDVVEKGRCDAVRFAEGCIFVWGSSRSV